ncbi:hypothetical protein, partial [Vibrio cholerae]|uniref:hypothetical protein n=1 Tax=Vibrio cholerae TaxID=666 RepID=UPI001F2302A1
IFLLQQNCDCLHKMALKRPLFPTIFGHTSVGVRLTEDWWEIWTIGGADANGKLSSSICGGKLGNYCF